MAGVHFLHNVSLFANLSSSELEPLAQRLIARKYREGEDIIQQGSPGSSLFIVKTGRVAIVLTDAAGHTHTLAEVGPGQVFGQFALLDGLPRSAGAVALERSEMLILTRPEFFMYLERHPAVAINLLVLLSRRLRFAMQLTEDEASTGSPRVRLARLLIKLADRYGTPENGRTRLALRITQGELAGLIGRPRSDVETALETFHEEHLLDIRGMQITIHDLEKLRAIAQTDPA